MTRILHHLARNQWKIKTYSGSTVLPEEYRNLPAVTCDDIAAWYETNRDVGMGEKDYGPFRLPFPLMWLEAHSPAGDKWEGPVGDMKLQAVEEHSKAWLLFQKGNVVMCLGMFFLLRGIVTAVPVIWTAQFSDEGTMTQDKWVMAYPDDLPREDALSLSNELNIPMLAIGFMNCRNVSIKDEPAPVRTGRKARSDSRARRSYTTYAEIIVKGLHNITTIGSLRSHTSQREMSPHVVRGHFKTYTEANPMFGNQTGTWWWEHHVRSGTEATPKTYVVTKAAEPTKA